MKEFTKKKPVKRWILERSTKGHENRRGINDTVASSYYQILMEVKKLFAQLPDKDSRLVFERDYRHDSSENLVSMHCFIQPSFYWHLECDYSYTYNIEYDFFHCPLENEIRELIRRKLPFQNTCKHKQLQPNCKEFYDNVLKAQESKFTYLL